MRFWLPLLVIPSFVSVCITDYTYNIHSNLIHTHTHTHAKIYVNLLSSRDKLYSLSENNGCFGKHCSVVECGTCCCCLQNKFNQNIMKCVLHFIIIHCGKMKCVFNSLSIHWISIYCHICLSASKPSCYVACLWCGSNQSAMGLLFLRWINFNRNRNKQLPLSF